MDLLEMTKDEMFLSKQYDVAINGQNTTSLG